MKKLILGIVAVVGLSFATMAQTEEVTTVVVSEKVQVSSTEYVYKTMDANTGISHQCLPTKAQIAIGEHALLKRVVLSGHSGGWSFWGDDNGRTSNKHEPWHWECVITKK